MAPRRRHAAVLPSPPQPELTAAGLPKRTPGQHIQAAPIPYENRLELLQRVHAGLIKSVEADGAAEPVQIFKPIPGRLLKPSKSAKDKSSMTVEAQQIIEQAQAEVRPPDTSERHPAPNTETTLGDIVTEAAFLIDVAHGLRERDVPLTVTELETTIGGLNRITQASDETRWQLGFHAVERGLISQAELARMLNTSTMTVSRRFRERDAEDPK